MEEERKGAGIDFSSFLEEAPEPELLRAGIDPEERGRSGSFFQCNHRVVSCGAKAQGVEVLPISVALERYGLEEYWWKAVEPEKDAFTKRVQLHQEEGYFIRSSPGAKVVYPLQACLYISVDRLAQDVHNVVIAEEQAHLHHGPQLARGYGREAPDRDLRGGRRHPHLQLHMSDAGP